MEVQRLSDLPTGEGKTFRQKENLNRLGRWVEALNTILGTNQTEMARRIGIVKQTLSDATRGKGGAGRETILALAEKYRLLAETREVILPVAWELFFSVSWFDSSEVIGGADQALENLEFVASVIKERDTLRRDIEKERARKGELTKENQLLRRENRAVKRDIERLRGMKGDP